MSPENKEKSAPILIVNCMSALEKNHSRFLTEKHLNVTYFGFKMKLRQTCEHIRSKHIPTLLLIRLNAF